MTEKTNSQQRVPDQKIKRRTQGASGKQVASAELKKAKDKIAELNDRLLRALADLDNYRKRSERENAQIILNANGNLIKAILPVLDDLERSLKSIPTDSDDDDFIKGIKFIHQKLMNVLVSFGLKPMESIGSQFDVEKHDALMQVTKDGVSPNCVVEEIEKGYLLHDQVLRHARVVVSR